MNIQKPEPRVDRQSGVIDLHSIFHTIQGEGPFAGQRAIFVRLAGCNLQCPMCDTEYTQARKQVTPAYILEQCNALHEEFGTDLVVITGGEPFRQNIELLVLTLLFQLTSPGYRIQIETNGTLSPLRDPKEQAFLDTLSLPNVTVVCSPKLSHINPDVAAVTRAWKYVVTHDEVDAQDGLPIHVLGLKGKYAVARPVPGPLPATVYVQPADAGDGVDNIQNMQTAVTSCLLHGYTLCLQMHKYAELP